MNSLTQITLCLLLSSQVFAITTKNINELKADVSETKKYFIQECQSELSKQEASCQQDMLQLRKSICSKKVELISFFEAILSDKNIDVVAVRV